MDEKEIREIEEELDEGLKDPWFKGPLRIITSVFLLLIILSWTYSIYGAALDPEPSKVPGVEEVLPYIGVLNQSYNVATRNDYYKLVNPSDSVIKQTADMIATISCEGSKICQVKAIYYFVRDNYEYISDPVDDEYIKDPKEFLSVGGGDCEDGAILLVNLLEAIGIKTEFVFVPGHALVRSKVVDISNRYLINDYVYMDWTCKNCEFGEVSLKVRENI